MKERMTEKKAKIWTGALVLTGIMLPIAAMFLMMRTELIWLSALIGALEIICGAVICSVFYSAESDFGDSEQENYL